MKSLLIPYVAVVVAMLLGDLLWIGVIMSNFYTANIGHLMGANVVWSAGIAFYLMYVAGLFLFAILPGMRSKNIRQTALLGGALGFLAYGTYDLTNQATLWNWPLLVTVVDMAWGTVFSAVLATLGFMLMKKFSGRKSHIA